MQHTNTRTNTTFTARSSKQGNMFFAIATRRQGNTESIIYREGFSTRSKAYRKAVKEALSDAMSHAEVYGA